MGIRYYAYAFDPHMTERALADPRSILSDDPLADAWGLKPHAMGSAATFTQAVPERDMLYLDKAWGYLQALTAERDGSGAVRAAHRMFEGEVTMRDWGWDPWVRVLVPEEIPLIARDLRQIDDARVTEVARPSADLDEEVAYVKQYLDRARVFTAQLAEDSRGMVYMIG